ncbi:hypothetical protein EH223_17210 [candidate division KSB1 bacterium]|nr:hypothetical protein [candidate division KSB1 bacterium]RQW00889.1 MAG: hypothetical protein EH223_17210 [candidate division KSB1 bacterium]
MQKTAIFIFSFFILVTLSMADVKYVSTTTVEMEGAVGSMMKFFGAGKPIKSVDYYKGDLKRSDTFDRKENLETSQIIDLESELFVTVDHKEREYSQMTFNEWKKRLEESLKQLGEEEYGATDTTAAEPEAKVDWELKFDVEETGEKEKIAGKNTEKVVLTIDLDAEVTSTEEQPGQEPESAKGGMIVTSTHWLYKGDNAAKKEMDDFNMRLAEKLGFVPGSASAQQMMAKIIEQNSRLGEAIETMQEEGAKLEGISMRVETLYETKVDPETARKIEEEKAREDEKEDTEIPTSVGGLLGGFGKKMMKKHMEKKDEGVKERSTLMRSTTEVLELDVSALGNELFNVPNDYKLEKSEE